MTSAFHVGCARSPGTTPSDQHDWHAYFCLGVPRLLQAQTCAAFGEILNSPKPKKPSWEMHRSGAAKILLRLPLMLIWSNGRLSQMLKGMFQRLELVPMPETQHNLGTVLGRLQGLRDSENTVLVIKRSTWRGHISAKSTLESVSQ